MDEDVFPLTTGNLRSFDTPVNLVISDAFAIFSSNLKNCKHNPTPPTHALGDELIFTHPVGSADEFGYYNVTSIETISTEAGKLHHYIRTLPQPDTNMPAQPTRSPNYVIVVVVILMLFAFCGIVYTYT